MTVLEGIGFTAKISDKWVASGRQWERETVLQIVINKKLVRT
jgi:hypothetical protein